MILTFYFISFVYMLSLKIQQLEAELNEMKKQWKSSQKALEQAQQQGLPIPRGLIILPLLPSFLLVKKLQEEKNEIAQQYAAKIDVSNSIEL